MFPTFLPLDPGEPSSVFEMGSYGITSHRDAWVYGSSSEKVVASSRRMIDFYNAQLVAFSSGPGKRDSSRKERVAAVKSFVDRDPAKIGWKSPDFGRIARGDRLSPEKDVVMSEAQYRPFYRQSFNRATALSHSLYRIPAVFPTSDTENLAICVSAKGSGGGFHVLMTSHIPDLHLTGDSMCFPRFVMAGDDASSADSETAQSNMFEASPSVLPDHNVTENAVETFRQLDQSISKDDIFYYVYGILHSPDYTATFVVDLKKSLPRIPQVKSAEDFWAFANAGRLLAELHTEYESAERWHELVTHHTESFDTEPADTLRVEKMRYPKVEVASEPGSKKVDDKTRIIYNEYISISGIPERAHDYRLGSRSAIDWILESYRVKTDKASGIVSDPNDWATEQDDPTYIIDLIGRVVTVSMKTLDIVENLPVLDL